MSSPPSPPPPSLLNVVGVGTVTDSLSPDRSSPLKILSPSILIITIILSVTVILSVGLCLLLRILNRRCLNHLSRSSTTRTVTTTPIFSSRRISPEIPVTSVINSLPMFTFCSITRRSNASSIAGDCAVCLSKFEKDDRLRLLPLCCHAFHVECVDTWLQSNLTCPLCRSVIVASESDLMKALQSASCNSFRLEIGNISRRGSSVSNPSGDTRTRSRSYSIGSFEYLVEEESEIALNHAHHRSISDNKDELVVVVESQAMDETALAAEVATGRSWLKDYVDRLSSSFSSRTLSFRSSGRFCTGSSRRTEIAVAGEWEGEEGHRVGEEISEMFRWLSGV